MKRLNISDSLIIKLYNNSRSICETARKLGHSNMLVRYRLIKNNIPIKKVKGGVKKGSTPWNKGTKGLMPVPWNKNKQLSEEHREKISQSKKGKPSPRKYSKHTEKSKNKISESRYMNGKRYGNRSDRYWGTYARQKLNEIGIFCKEKDVHHIDGDKTNNHISNLKLMSRSEHTSLHWQQGDIR